MPSVLVRSIGFGAQRIIIFVARFGRGVKNVDREISVDDSPTRVINNGFVSAFRCASIESRFLIRKAARHTKNQARNTLDFTPFAPIYIYYDCETSTYIYITFSI